MRHHHEPEARYAPEPCHLLRRGLEYVSDNRNGGYACFFEHDGVEQTARRACASIADAGDDEIGSSFELRDLRVEERRPLRLMHEYLQFHTMGCCEFFGHLAQHGLGVLLGI